MSIKALTSMHGVLLDLYREALMNGRIPAHQLLDEVIKPLRQFIDNESERQLAEVQRLGT